EYDVVEVDAGGRIPVDADRELVEVLAGVERVGVSIEIRVGDGRRRARVALHAVARSDERQARRLGGAGDRREGRRAREVGRDDVVAGRVRAVERLDVVRRRIRSGAA